MNILLRLFPAGHFVISVLFFAAGAAFIVLAALQLWEGVQPFEEAALLERLNAVLESIAVLTVAVAALELGQTILEEEVHRQAQMSAPTRVRRFSQDAPELLPYAASVGFAAALLLVAWGIFIRLNRSAEELEPEAMQAAKREDRKIEKSAKGEAKP
jgi:hypothetical protein